MAKEIGNPIEIRVQVQNGDGYPIDYVKACYTMTCEHEVEECRMLILTGNGALESAVGDLVEEAVSQINTEEGL